MTVLRGDGGMRHNSENNGNNGPIVLYASLAGSVGRDLNLQKLKLSILNH